MNLFNAKKIDDFLPPPDELVFKDEKVQLS